MASAHGDIGSRIAGKERRPFGSAPVVRRRCPVSDSRQPTSGFVLGRCYHRRPMNSPARYYLTTAIFYPSRQPALHSLFEAIGADVVARYHRLTGDDTRFLTGMDEHSANVERAAVEAGVSPRELVDPWAETWRSEFDRFGISYSRFIRTIDPDHARASVEMVRRAMAAGDIYKGVYSGWYCPGDNEFKTEAQLVDGHCPDHPTLELQWLEEENWFFALSKYQEKLEQLYRENPQFCEPEHFRNEVLGWLREGLRDFSISRSGTQWGIPFPDDPDHRILRLVRRPHELSDRGRLSRRRGVICEVVARRRPRNRQEHHPLSLPVLAGDAMSAGLPLPKLVFAHGFMLDKGAKMSKTQGNVLDPDDMVAKFGVDGVRYMVLAEVPFERDADVTFDGFARRYNADLANDFGNLLNRTLNMTGQVCRWRASGPSTSRPVGAGGWMGNGMAGLSGVDREVPAARRACGAVGVRGRSEPFRGP